MDGVISTAAVPGRKAPLLIIEDAVKRMKPGSVIVDLAAETGGNCELTKAGETVVEHDVKIIGAVNLPATMPDHASQLYAKNVQNLVDLMTDDEGGLTLNFEDEIIKGACITHEGQIVHEGAKKAAGGGRLAMDLMTELTILVLAAFVGFEVISKVPNSLHTPLMSRHQRHPRHRGAGRHPGHRRGRRRPEQDDPGDRDRLRHDQRGRRLPGHRPDARDVQGAPEAEREGVAPMTLPLASFLQDPDFINVLYIVAIILFILGMRQVTGPTTARRGNATAAVGMAIAVIATLLQEQVGDYGLIALGIVIGTAIGVPAAQRVKMTAMPQMVALFNGVGGGAVALISWAEYRHAWRSAPATPSWTR